MLEKPTLQDNEIAARLRAAYGLNAVQIDFLPLGADLNTAVYRVQTDDDKTYFCKLRRGALNEIGVALPKYLFDQGIEQIIPPLATRSGQLWAGLDTYKVLLYPFVEGHNAYEVDLTDRHWIDLGAALKRIQMVVLPPALTQAIRRETYAPRWREICKAFIQRIEADVFDDPVAVEMAVFLKQKRAVVQDLVARAERYALTLESRSPEFVLCHSDIHAGNVLVGNDGTLYIVDWDDPILAPKERDLMYAGGGQFRDTRTPREEETLFYRGYGQTQVDRIALAYYRYERIVEDIAVYCEQIFLSHEGGQDREQSLVYLKSNFLPNNTIELAYRSEAKGID